MPINPCLPSPCGPYAECRDAGGIPSCSCSTNYVGTPPNCRPECIVHSECPSNSACIAEKCSDPCPGSCGIGADCNVINHIPICSCPADYTGDPFRICNLKPLTSKSFRFTRHYSRHITFFQLQYQHRKIHVIPHLVVQMPCVITAFVVAFQNFTETLLENAGQNAY